MWACRRLSLKLEKLLFNSSNRITYIVRASGQSSSHISSNSWRENGIYPSIYTDVSIPNITLTQFIFDSQERFADQIAFTNGETNQTWSHREVRDAAHRLASALARLGVMKNDIVAIISPNCPEFAIALLAIMLIGGTATTCSSTYTSGEICYQLINSDSSCVICHEDNLHDVMEACKDNKIVINILIIGHERQGVLSIQKLIKEDDGKGIPSHIEINPAEDVATLPYSSGTTGLPKGVMLTHRNIVANLSQFLHPDVSVVQLATGDSQDRVVGVVPFYHISGISAICLALVTGMQLFTLKQFNQQTYISAVQKLKPTTLHLVPPLMGFLNTSKLATPEMLSSTRNVICGAAPIGKSLLEKFFQKFGHHMTFIEAYGMTEASPATHISRRDKLVLGSCGPALPNTWTKIINLETNLPVKRGEEGEMCVKGPQVMKGYYKNEKATRETIDKEGWLHTGDIAWMDEEENVFIVDRVKELIKVKGLQVAPAELENLLRQHPSIEDVAVTSVPDEKAGELPRAIIVPIAGQIITEREIQDFVAARVARYKRLDGGVVFVEEIPKSAAGKILRRNLKQTESLKVSKG